MRDLERGFSSMTVTPTNKKPVYAGLSISHEAIELVVFSPKTLSVEQSVSLPIPDGLFDNERDSISDPALLKGLLAQAFQAVKLKPATVHLSLPGTLLRMVEMPKMDPSGLYVSLSSEAERYKTFDNTEASVDFIVCENPHLPPNMLQLVLGAVRSDVLHLYLKTLKELKVKVHSIGLEPLSILRGMAGTGVLDSLVQQIGTDACWGMMFVEASRVRFTLWRCDKLLELRELSMDTHEFVHAAPGSIVVEDMLEEIRRTVKTEQPVLWLTHNMPPAMENALAEVLGCPVRMAPMGNAINMGQPLQLSSLGSAMTSVVPFPFELDITEGIKSAGGSSASATSEVAADIDSGDGPPPWLIPAGFASLALGGIASGILFAMASMAAMQIPDLTSKVESAKVEVAGLQTRQAELKKKVELDKSLLDMVEKAKIRNHVYVAFTDDLKRKTPEQLWVQQLQVNDEVSMEGKALNHQSVINFAKSFDTAPYTRAVLIDSIKEGRLGSSLVYDFKISGGVNLDKSIMPPAAAAPVSDPSSSVVEPAKSGA
ncbi:MAG: hypothetical protein K0Q50_187 [Vampirovibrio sp.]|nr:hypothetical protein [Vampirovibrio sp.]